MGREPRVGPLYLDLETHSLSPKDGDIATIQYQQLDQPGRPLVILKAWEHPDGERGIVKDFFAHTRAGTNRWHSGPWVGWNLDFERRWLYDRGVKYGCIAWGRDVMEWSPPIIDLQQFAITQNAMELKGTRMDEWTGKATSGAHIPTLLSQRRYPEVLSYVRKETAAFVDFYFHLRDNPLFSPNRE